MNTTVENYNATNHNLSSILAQIQDNGPAYAESTKRREVHQAPPIDTKPTNTPVSTNDEDTVSLSTAGVQQQTSKKPRAVLKKEISPGVWLQLLLLLISAALLATTLFRLDVQNNSIEESLSVYDETIDEKIQESVDLQKSTPSNNEKKINTVLKTLQSELATIKTDYTSLDNKYAALLQTQKLEKSSVQNSPDNIKLEISSLKNELNTVKQKLKTINTNTSTTANTVVNNGLTVSLASLTNKLKADDIVQQLSAEGLLPNITQAVVNGTRVYRLSVSGFENIEQAESFIRKADTKYGMKDSRIRKG